MANIDRGFQVDVLSVGETALVTSGNDNPSIIGYEAPIGSLYLSSTGNVFVKNGNGDVDWIAASNSDGSISTSNISGFVNRIDSEISFDETTRVFNISPTLTSYVVYYHGVSYVIEQTKSITLSNTSGGRYITYNHNTGLLEDSGENIDISSGIIIVAYIYFDAINSKAIVFGDERHSVVRDVLWHSSQHFNVGAVWRSGGEITYVLDDDTNVGISFSNPIVIYDEDINHTIVHSDNPNAAYQQILAPIAQLPVLYLSGNNYVQQEPDSFIWLHSLNNVAYFNNVVEGIGSLSEVPNNSYINYWIFGTNDSKYPVKIILGRNNYTTLAEASAEKLDSSGIEFPEMALMYRIVIQYKNTYTNNIARIAIHDVVRYDIGAKTSETTISVTHQSLVGRDLINQHPIAAITNLQTELDGKALLEHNHDIANLNVTNIDENSLLISSSTEWQAVNKDSIILPSVGAVSRDLCGFPNRTDTELSFDSITRTLTLTPLNINACVYKLGVRYDIQTPLSVVWSNTNGGRYIIYEPTLNQLVEYGPTPDIISGQVLVAYIFWNVSSQYLVLAGDERHGSHRDPQWHFNQHRDVGAIWRSGGALTFTLNDDTQTTLGISGPIIFADEDLEHSINNNPAPIYPQDKYDQILSPAAWLPVSYLNNITMDEIPATSSYPWLYGTNRALYNQVLNGVGSLVEVPNDSYINYWMIATNDTEFPLKLIVGREVFQTKEQCSNETLLQYGLPFAEMAIMYRIALHIDDTHINNPAKVSLEVVINAYRSVSGGVTAITAISHDTLSGRELPYQHPIDAIDGLRSELDGKSSITHVHSLDELTDVSLTAPVAGQTLYFNGSTWVNLGDTGSNNGGGAAKRIWSNTVPQSTGTTVITPGTTQPTVSQGSPLWSLTITPYSVDAEYVIQSNIVAAGTTNNSYITLALFRDDVYIGGSLQIVQSSNNSATLSFSITDMPSTTSPVTYQVRIGISIGTWYANRRGAEITYGGLNTGWVIWEY